MIRRFLLWCLGLSSQDALEEYLLLTSLPMSPQTRARFRALAERSAPKLREACLLRSAEPVPRFNVQKAYITGPK